MPIQFVLILCIVGAFVVASIAEGMVLQGAANLPPPVRERIFQREARLGAIWRLIEGLAIAILVLAFAKIFGFVRFGPAGMPLGFYLFAGGFSLLCIERVLRSWGTYSSYAKEDESGDARGSALNAALLVTVVELGLAAGLCWFVATRAIAAGGSSKPAAATEQEPDAANGQDPGPGTAKTPDPNLWIPEREARELIGRDDEYFDLLVRWGDVRPKQLGGQKLYRRRDLTSIKEAGLPTVQYMKEGLANFEKIKGETQPPPEAPKPPVEKPGEELKE